MSYRRRPRNRSPSLSLVLAGVGISVFLIGFVCALGALALASTFGGIGGPLGTQLVGLATDPLAVLFQHGVLVLAGGLVLVVGGGCTVLLSG